jgi:CO dehydrogenase maturation factor
MSTLKLEELKTPILRELCGRRILICGKGGSGKTTLVALMANALRARGVPVLLVDGDASNPGGLARIMFGAGSAPRPLIEFFGGRKLVTCPVDDPSALIRPGTGIPVPVLRIKVEDVPEQYFLRDTMLVLFQVGKISSACEGCDGPMSKVTRDFLVQGDHVNLIDVEAGIEHFGRGVEKNVDVILAVVDPTYESLLIATKVHSLAEQMGINQVWAVLNKFAVADEERTVLARLGEGGVGVIASIRNDPFVARVALSGSKLGDCPADADALRLVDTLAHIIEKKRQGRDHAA